MSPENPSNTWLQGDSLMTRQLQALDWSGTPLGALADWPPSLRMLVNLVLQSRQPMYLAWGPELVLIYNDSYIPILGNKHPQGLGQPFLTLWTGITADFETMLAALRRGEAQYFEDMPVTLTERPDRPLGWFTFSWTPLQDESGQVQGFLCVASETTKRMLKSARLAKLMQLMDEMERSTHSGSWELDLAKGEMVCSAGLLRLHGLDPAGPPPTLEEWGELLHAEEAELRNLTASQLAEPNDKLKEYRIVTPSGKTRWLSTSYTTERDAQGQPSVIRGLTVDLTQRKTLQQENLNLTLLMNENLGLANALRAQREQLDMALEAADLGLWDLDLHTEIFTADHRHWRMLGEEVDAYQPTLQSWQARIHPDDLAATQKAFEDHWQGRTESYLAEYRIRHRQGHWIWVMAQGKALKRDPLGRPLRAVGTLQDITLRKRQSEQGMELLQQVKSLIQDMGQGPAQSAHQASGRPAASQARELEQLTRRQRQLLELIARGRTSAQIADELNISTPTAVSHRRDLMRKLQLHNAADVTRFAIRHGLVRGE